MSDTISTLAQKLRPHWLRDVANVTTTAGSGGTAGVTDHGALTGLLDDDHPQYLTPARGDVRYIPSTRTLTAGDGLTGGGDLSANRTFALTTPGTLTVSSSNSSTGSHTHAITSSSSPGANARILASTAGGGLTLVDLTTSGNIYSNGYLDFGTDTMYEDASYLQVAGSKAVRFAQNIGNANWTVYNAGGAQFSGNVDIISGGDLTVAGSGSYAGNTVLFADSSGGNVGIMMTPDSQFALDINGPARATYWIGPHAIQLKNVLLLSHFDGRAPFETNFSGEPNGHMGQVATVAGSVIYRPGKFGKALQTGTTTLNRCTNPSFETNTTGWTYSDSNTSGSMARTQYNAYVGTYSLQLYNNNGGEDDCAYFNIAGLSASTAYTVSAYAYVTDEFVSGALSNRGLYALDTNSAGTAQTTTITGSTGGLWVRHTVTVTMSGSPGNLQIRLYNPKGRTYWDAVQVEQAGGATGYADGDMPGHTWTGTAHASTSNRTTTAYLTYPTSGNINTLRGTIMAWVYPYAAYGAVYLWRATGTTTGNIILRTNGANLEAFWGTQQITATGALTGNTWQHVAITYDSTTLRLYVNGVEAANGAASGFSGVPASMYVGIADGTNGPFAGLIDDLCILDRAAPANEIRSVYESNAPVFAETSTFSFRPTPKGLIWADDEGLWMRDTAGSPVLGAYGGDAATKSWAGFTMAAGDIVIGSNAVGSSAIWWDKSAGKFGFYGAGSGTPQVEINTSGQITFGGGNSAIDASGLALDSKTSWAYTDVGTSVSWYTDPVARTGYAGSITAGDWAAGGTEAGILFHVSNAFPSDHLLQVRWGTGTVYDVWHGGNIGITSWGGSEYVFDKTIEAVQVRANGDSAGKASTVTITNGTQGVAAGTGTIKMNGATARNSTGWLKIYVGTSIKYVPYFDTVTG